MLRQGSLTLAPWPIIEHGGEGLDSHNCSTYGQATDVTVICTIVIIKLYSYRDDNQRNKCSIYAAREELRACITYLPHIKKMYREGLYIYACSRCMPSSPVLLHILDFFF